MNSRILCLVSGLGFVSILTGAMIVDPAWYWYPVIGSLFLICWHISPNRLVFRFLQLMCGLVGSIAVWALSPIPGVLSVCLVYVIFLLQNTVIESAEDGYWFLLFAVLSVSIAILIDLSPHTLIPALLVLVGAGCLLLYIRIAEYRLVREFRGDNQ